MSRTLAWVAAVLGLVFVAAGVALVGNQPADFGWTAYGPVPPAPVVGAP